MNFAKIINRGESETVEFKSGFNKEAVETVVAFSNTRGGIIFIGVTNAGEIKGTNVGNESLNEWCNTISINTEPRLIPEIQLLEIDTKKVVVIQVSEYPLKPVSFKGRCFRRLSNSNRQMSPQEIA